MSTVPLVILGKPRWVIDGFGTPRSFEDLLGAADVLVYVERAAIVHYWWVTKRFILSPFSKPPGWPARSPMLRSTISSYRFLKLSYKFWTPAFRAKLLALQPGKRVYIVERQSDVRAILNELKRVGGVRCGPTARSTGPAGRGLLLVDRRWRRAFTLRAEDRLSDE
jgi:hypothetical protein